MNNRPTLHHVGYVVDSIEARIEDFRTTLGAVSKSPIFEDPIQRSRVAFLTFSGENATQLELVEPLGTDSPVARFLDRGGGLHHLCYEVDDLRYHIEKVKPKHAVLVCPPHPAVAFGGRRIAWVVGPGSLLVEYLERQPSPQG